MEARDYVLALVERGLTQVEIASKTGIPQPTISKVARGDVADVMSRNYRKLQALYEATPPKVDEPSAAGPAPESAAGQGA